MRKIFFFGIVILTTLGFNACSDDNENTGTTITTDDSGNKNISGKIRIVELDNDEEPRLVAYVTDEIDEIAVLGEVDGSSSLYDELLEMIPVSDGDFTYTLPASLGSKYLEAVGEIFEYEMEYGEMKINNLDARIGFLDFYSFKNEFPNGYLGRISLDFTTEARMVYADRDVKITGTYQEEEDIVYYVENYDISLKKGWNTIVSKETISRDKETYKYTANNEPGNMIWVVLFNDDYYSYSAGKKNSAKQVGKDNGMKKKTILQH